MRLLRDEQQYLRILDDFVARRLDATGFIAGFRHLWRCDGADGIDGFLASKGISEQGGLYGLLDTVNALCETYEHNLPSGSGYRVSEEQFRKEVDSILATLPLAGPPRA
ncbi:MAG: hypothetical protein ABIO06_00130 [Pseudolysinimonas sp.]|jgi:hypothetical protein